MKMLIWIGWIRAVQEGDRFQGIGTRSRCLSALQSKSPSLSQDCPQIVSTLWSEKSVWFITFISLILPNIWPTCAQLFWVCVLSTCSSYAGGLGTGAFAEWLEETTGASCLRAWWVGWDLGAAADELLTEDWDDAVFLFASLPPLQDSLLSRGL